MSTLVCTSCGNVDDKAPFKPGPKDRACPECGGAREPLKQLRRTSQLASTGSGASSKPKTRSTLKQGRGFAVHPAQRAKVEDLRCIVTGQDRHEATIHPMHVWDRGRGGCDDPLCVVPGRADIHRLYDEKKLDILPALITGGYYAEIAHVIAAHEVSPTRLLERLTCREWVPVDRHERAAA